MSDRPDRPDRLARLEARVEALAGSVAALADRLAAVEDRPSADPAEVAGPLRLEPAEAVAATAVALPAAGEPAPPPAAPEAPAVGERWGPVALLGRTLMVLGGAYLFRALTESGAVAAELGVALGLAYALVWLAFADRAGAHGRHLSACFHGAAFALIAAPLCWEAASRFGVLSATGGSAVLAAATGAALAVAWRRDLRPVAWIASLAAVLSAWAFMGSLAPLFPPALVLVLVGVADDWVARDRGWSFLPWVTAAAADLTLAFMALGEAVGEGSAGRPGSATALVVLLLALFVLYAGSAAARAVRPAWRARWLDLVQLPAATVVGYGGAFLLARRSAELALPLGVGSLLAGTLCLGAMRLLYPERAARRPAYLLFAWLGPVLVLGGTALLLPAALAALVWSVLTVAVAWLASRRRSVILGFHAATYGIAAAAAGGLLIRAAYAFAGPAEAAWAELRWSAVVVLAALAVAASLDLPGESRFWSPLEARAPKLLLLAVLAWGALGAGLALLVPVLAGTPGEDAVAWRLALLRMAAISAAALFLAWLGRFRRYREAVWLVYPVLIAGGFKLILEDFLLGRAAELFGALALYGATLILAPRLARTGVRASRRRAAGAEEASPPHGVGPNPPAGMSPDLPPRR
jgi:hypothetical protein